MTDAEVDRLARLAADHVKAGGRLEVVVTHKCRRCGGTEPYRHNGTPNWMNRWSCPKCKRHESR